MKKINKVHILYMNWYVEKLAFFQDKDLITWELK